MLPDLHDALIHLTKARTLVRRHLSNYLYPLIHEDLDYDIQALRHIISALTRGDSIPGHDHSRPDKRRQPPPGAARHHQKHSKP